MKRKRYTDEQIAYAAHHISEVGDKQSAEDQATPPSRLQRRNNGTSNRQNDESLGWATSSTPATRSRLDQSARFGRSPPAARSSLNVERPRTLDKSAEQAS